MTFDSERWRSLHGGGEVPFGADRSPEAAGGRLVRSAVPGAPPVRHGQIGADRPRLVPFVRHALPPLRRVAVLRHLPRLLGLRQQAHPRRQLRRFSAFFFFFFSFFFLPFHFVFDYYRGSDLLTLKLNHFCVEETKNGQILTLIIIMSTHFDLSNQNVDIETII